ncbi:MAG: TolC family protein [Campylobacterales bacterium]|nr:TolC family protein [Campylobacterales bacterium]
MRMISLVAAAFLHLFAQSPGYTDRLNLDEALALLASNNLELKAADYDLKSAETSYEQALGAHYGSLDFIQNVSRTNDALNTFGFKLTGREATFGDFGFSEFLAPMGQMLEAMNANPGALPAGFTQDMGSLLQITPEDLNHPSDRNFFQSKLQYTLPLYVGGKISAYVEAAKTMQQLKTLDRAQLLLLKVYETRKAFYDMRLLEEALNNLRTIHANIGKVEKMTETMIQEGYAKQTDLLEVRSKRSNVERSIRQMEANEQLLYHYLSFLLNQNVQSIELPEHDAALPHFSSDAVIEGNLDVRRAQTGLKIREHMLDAERADYLPIIGMQAEVQTAAESFGEYAADQGSYTVGLQLKWNFFNGLADNAKYERARVETLKTRTQVELAKKGIALQLDKIMTEIKSLDYEITALEHELELANTIYESYEERYKEQLASMSDLVIKQSEQLSKVLELLKVKNQRNERVFALEQLLNGVQS